MFYYHYSISVCRSGDQLTTMAKSNNLSKNRKVPNSIPVCPQSGSAVIDIVMLTAAIFSFTFLLFPYVKFLTLESIEISSEILDLIGEEISEAPTPWIYGSIGIIVFSASLSAWSVLSCTTSRKKKCMNPNCRGLRNSAAFDIKLETEEEWVKKKQSKCSIPSIRDGIRNGRFEFTRDRQRELETELKKVAPVNGRAVLVLRAKCGCSVGKFAVLGPRKHRNVKKW